MSARPLSRAQRQILGHLIRGESIGLRRGTWVLASTLNYVPGRSVRGLIMRGLVIDRLAAGLALAPDFCCPECRSRPPCRMGCGIGGEKGAAFSATKRKELK